MKRDLDTNVVVECLNDGLDTAALYEEYFDGLARKVLHGCCLQCGSATFNLLEVEVYCRDDREVPMFVDPFAHGDPMQKRPRCFYFHKQGKGYRGGTYKGLDFTFGCANVYGGLLIRSIQNTETNVVICGPSLCVDAILEALGCVDIVECVAKFVVQGENEAFRLRERRAIDDLPIYRSMRVGLSLKTKNYEENVVSMWCAPLRFTVQPQLLTKHKHLIVLELLASQPNMTHNQIASIVGTTLVSVESCFSAFNKGKASGEAKKFFGAKLGSVYDCCECFGACRYSTK
jgi:hypothetical protein